MSGDLIDTTEMYLKTVFELREAGVVPMRARIAERLGHSGPTVSQTVARMERDGLLHLDAERRIRLTDEGREIATAVMRKHRLAERHLLDVIGLDFALVHEEACRWEHVMSLAVEERIAQQLEPPYVDPYGNPIPGLQSLGIAETAITPDGKDQSNALETLADVATAGEHVRVRLERIGERAQSDPELLGELARHGLFPGAEAQMGEQGGSAVLQVGDGDPLLLDDITAGQLLVTRIAAG